MPDRLTLAGCTPTPLASYLKALGVLRLLSSGQNNAKGEPADPGVRGWWEGERFHLRTALSREEVASFFLHDYAPTPIIAPWNGGSGFYPGYYSQAGLRPLRSPNVSGRFRPYAAAVEVGINTLGRFGLPIPVPVGETKAAKKKRGTDQAKRREAAKRDIISCLRAYSSDSALPWLDATIVLSGEGMLFPPLLGTGANDGNLDFTNSLMHHLFSRTKRPFGVFDASTGEPSSAGTRLLGNALFATTGHQLTGAPIGQYSPGGAGGPNATTGYSGKSTVNPWDYILMLEGATAFACTAVRRHQSNAIRSASFPFTVRTSGAGWGGVEAADESSARAEFWAPLWSRPAKFREVEALFGEGRAVTNGRTASDGLEFARSLATLGVSRGFSEFLRYGFFQRAGKMYYAAAIGRRRAAPSPGAELVADLDQGGWLDRVRRVGRGANNPAAVRTAVKRLEDSLFDLLAPEASPRSVRAALKSVGRLADWLASSPKGREAIPPPPLLSRKWVRRADDGSAEFRVAAALAGLGIPSPPGDGGQPGSDTPALSSKHPPMAAHFAPLTNRPGEGFERDTFFSGRGLRWRRQWAAADKPPTVVWGHGELVSNLTVVLERRLVEGPVRGLSDKPLDGAGFARLSEVTAFLAGDFDDARCAALLAGLVWARPSWLPASGGSDETPTSRAVAPFAYAALKPIFSMDTALRDAGAIPDGGSVPIPPGIVAQLRAGGRRLDGRAVQGAVRAAFARARSSGMPSPYDPIRFGGGAEALRAGRIGVGVHADRLAAAVLIPLARRGLASLLRRAYPEAIPDVTTQLQEKDQNVK